MATEVTSITKSLDRIADALEGQSGGDSGDLATANVTVVFNNQNAADLYAPFVIEGDAEFQLPPTIVPSYLFSQGETNSKVALYKGTCVFVSGGLFVASISGNAESIGDVAVLVKGDCTITIGEEDVNQIT